jgi:long-chain fatty acid transport protein
MTNDCIEAHRVDTARPGRRWRDIRVCAATAVLVATPLAPASAAGFYLSSVGSPGSLGTAASANVTNSWGPDATWANPAGLTGVGERRVMTASGQLLVPFGQFDPSVAEAGGDDGGDAGDPALIPSFFYSQRLNDDWAFGFGVAALQGGGVDYGDNFVGRYNAIDVALTGLGATWSLGHQLTDRLSWGIGGTVVQTQYQQTIAVNQGAAPDGRVAFRDLDDVGLQGVFGLQYEFTERLMFGATYRSEFDAKLEGNVKFRNIVIPGVPSRRNLKVDWTNPQWIEAGFRYVTGRGHAFFLSGNWQEWSEFSQNQLTIDTDRNNIVQQLDRDFDDTWSVGIGYATKTDTTDGLAFGLRYESSPVEDDRRTVDLPFDESWQLSASYGRFKSDGSSGWSVGTTVVFFDDAEIDQTVQNNRFAGKYDDNIVAFVGLNFRF